MNPTTPPRFNIYGFIHKALRHFMGDTLQRLGRLDPADAQDMDAVLGQTRQLLDFCRKHLEHENRFVHPALEACEPGSTDRIAGEHGHHEEEIVLLHGQVDALGALRGDPAACERALGRLYCDMAVFVGHNLEHMDYEERAHNAALWAHYSDAQLHAIEGAIVASLPPADSMMSLGLMLVALSHPERVRLLAGLRANAPAAVFEAVTAMARQRLEPRDWDKLRGSLPAAMAA